MRVRGFRIDESPSHPGGTAYIANMVCECGADLVEGQKFCHECGTKQEWVNVRSRPILVNQIEVEQLILARIKEKYLSAVEKDKIAAKMVNEMEKRRNEAV